MNIGLREAKLNFELKSNIGQEGKNSEVFIAHDIQFDAEIVIKRIPKANFVSADEYYKEAKCLYASKHQNIVGVNYSCEDDDYIYIAMPYYHRGSLESLIKSKFLTVREILKYSIDFLSGLNHIHTKGLIHFDIKPTNILISDSNEALVTDFGLAKFTNQLRVAEQDIFYSLHTPPESLLTNLFTIQADIYQAGLTLYRLCNGTNLLYSQVSDIAVVNNVFDKQLLDKAILKGEFPNRNFFHPHIPQKLRNIIRKALNINPEDRYNNLIEMLNELSSVDENLDWNFSITPHARFWELIKDGKNYQIQLEKKGSYFDINTFKTMIDSGRRTKETVNCLQQVTGQKLDSVLKKVLKTY